MLCSTHHEGTVPVVDVIIKKLRLKIYTELRTQCVCCVCHHLHNLDLRVVETVVHQQLHDPFVWVVSGHCLLIGLALWRDACSLHPAL
eukprot:COSAG02_NODE_1782_length_10945_cov_9.882722_6_plen_87_part_01